MNILLVYPETPHTFWSFHNALKFISKKSSEPPLGLLTIAAMLPEEWNKKLIDMNVTVLRDQHIHWADYVFISGMNVHTASIKGIIKRCRTLGTKIVAGGPVFTTDHREFEGIDHYILNEAEVTLPMFLNDLQNGQPQSIYSSPVFPDISLSPAPEWDLIEKNKYASMSIQYSRGCPYNCDFCSITMLNGRKPRTKSRTQFIAELESLYRLGWRGSVFVVDDNFIGNKPKLKQDILPALIEWSQMKNYPFSFMTEVSINLADDEELITLMVKAGFNAAFVGIESPNPKSLAECGKSQNLQRDLADAVKKLHRNGLMVSGGFIVGFDNDPPTIFEQLINFIQQSGIVTAMVGLLNAPSGTRLFQRLKSENRLLHVISGDNMDGSINFIPKMDLDKLKEGYGRIIKTIYTQKQYYERVKTFLKEYHIPSRSTRKMQYRDLKALMKSLWILGVLESGRLYFWKLFFLSIFRYPKKFALSITLAIYGYHFRRVAENI